MKKLVFLSLPLLLGFVWFGVVVAAEHQKMPQHLWKKAQEQGTVRLIVQLNYPGNQKVI